MLYEKARSGIQSGDILGWQGHSLFSRLTRRVTMSAYSHVGTAWRVGDRLFVLEALGSKGVRMAPLSHRRPFVWVNMQSPWRKKAEAFALDTLDAEYGWFDALFAGLGVPMVSEGRWICSEYSREISRLCGEKIPDTVQTPAQLIKWCQINDRKIQYVE